jgi:hypothetical protein
MPLFREQDRDESLIRKEPVVYPFSRPLGDISLHLMIEMLANVSQYKYVCSTQRRFCHA